MNGVRCGCGDTQSKIAAQLVHDGIGLKYRSCVTKVGQWYDFHKGRKIRTY